jgi:hypothetical protein
MRAQVGLLILHEELSDKKKIDSFIQIETLVMRCLVYPIHRKLENLWKRFVRVGERKRVIIWFWHNVSIVMLLHSKKW